MGNPVHSRPGSIASPAIACLTAPTAPDPSTRLPNRPTESHRPGPRLSSPAYCPADPAPAPLPRTAIGAPNDNQRPPPAPFIGIERGPSRPTALTPCSNPKAAPHGGDSDSRPTHGHTPADAHINTNSYCNAHADTGPDSDTLSDSDLCCDTSDIDSDPRSYGDANFNCCDDADPHCHGDAHLNAVANAYANP